MFDTRVRLTQLTLLLALLLSPLSASGALIEFVVDETADLVDDNPGDGSCKTFLTNCSLRAAIQESNALSGVDQITLPAGTFRLQLPGKSEDAALTGDLDILYPVDIVGAGPGETIIDAGGIDRVFEIHDLASTRLQGMTIRGGVANQATHPGYQGGGVNIRDATVVLEDVEITDNRANAGGGIYGDWGSDVTVRNASLRANSAVDYGFINTRGGAIYSTGALDLDRVEISDNDSLAEPAGVYVRNGSPATVTNTTISDNDGLGLETFNNELEMVNSTIYGNSGGGLRTYSSSGTEPLTVRTSIIANNVGNDCTFNGTPPATMIFASAYNLDSDGTCPLDFLSVDLPLTDPALGPLVANGGHTRTRVPVASSPVIDVGDNGVCPMIDQRGAPRPLDGAAASATVCDIGAVEVLPCDAASPNEILPLFDSAAANLFVACYSITNGTTFRIQSGGLVQWNARDLLELRDGFEVATGGTFSAHLDPEAGSTTSLP